MRIVWLPIFGAVLAALALCQDPVPVWPANGAVPSGLNGKRVFLTKDREEIVVLLPSPDGRQRALRVPLHNRISARLAVSITAGGGQYRFAYTLSNTPKSRDAVTGWSLVITPNGPGFEMSGEPWPGAPTSMPIIKQIGLDLPPGGIAMWSPPDERHPLEPGESAAGFWISSAEKPGFTTAYVGHFPPFDASQDWPEEVLIQLSLLGDPAWSDQHIVTFGPRFLPGSPRVAIAADFAAGIKKLIGSGNLGQGSALVQEMLRKLPGVRDDQAGLAVESKPVTPFESELKEALLLSLGR